MDPNTDVNPRWLTQLFSTEPAARGRAQAAMETLYEAAGYEIPKVVWCESPFEAYWAYAQLLEPHDWLWRGIIEEAKKKKQVREKMDQVRAKLCEQLGETTWEGVLAATGMVIGQEPMQAQRPTGMVYFRPIANPGKSLQSELLAMRLGLYKDVAAFTKVDIKSVLFQAESRFLAVVGSTLNTLLTRSFFAAYPFYKIAMDEAEIGAETPPPMIAAAWEIARSSGFWWPFAKLALMSERPSEIHVDKDKLLHRGDGPAVVYRDGAPVYAWHGAAMPEKWILHPDTIPVGKLKQFDAEFRKQVEARVGAGPSKSPASKSKESAILKAEIKGDVAARVDQLRQHAEGRLPFYERYVGGECEKVWTELIALGPSVREDPHAADALAVAYETMNRILVNIQRTLERLRAMNYRFKNPKCAYLPPDKKTWKQVQKLEKSAGTLPLSLWAFYEIVGSVDWTGEHPSLAPREGKTCPDPLVVYAVGDALAFFEECEHEEEDEVEIIIAPDDLHKSDTSGGDPYTIATPDLRADGELLNERHELFFVNYLRLCFRFGGFPGYEGMDEGAPAELKVLQEGLAKF